MAYSWDEFKQSHQERKNALKGFPNITIYGSYKPQEDLDMLVRLKRVLIDDGYKNTALCIDRAGSDDPLEMSQQCLEFSDINLFIFTRTGKRHGVIDEIATLTMDSNLFNKIQFSRVFDQIKKRRSSVPPVTRSRIEQNDISRREFREIQELEKIIVKSAYWLTIKWVRFKGI